MRFKNMRDGDTRFARHLHVNIDIGSRIENRSHAFIVIAKQVREFRDACGLNGFKNERHAREFTAKRSPSSTLVVAL